MDQEPIKKPFTDFPIPPPVNHSDEYIDNTIRAIRRVFIPSNPPATYHNILTLLAEIGVSEEEYQMWGAK